jgi:hypothetical protein
VETGEEITVWVRVSERGLKAGGKNSAVYLKVKRWFTNRMKELKR